MPAATTGELRVNWLALPAGLVLRARIVLAAADGESNTAIAARLGVTHWSSRLPAAELGISNVAVVANIWREHRLQPWRIETFKFSTDPKLDAKVRDVVGLPEPRPCSPRWRWPPGGSPRTPATPGTDTRSS
jgi:hypothetical protein